MPTAIVLAVYVGDEILSALMPFSSGPFALFLLVMLATQVRPPGATTIRVLAWAVTALVVGTVGALLSGTPTGVFSAATIALLAALWSMSSALRGRAATLISPRAAFVGVMVSMVFLLVSLLGWDAYSAFAGYATSRGSGVYAEPSHMALYLTPLTVIAWQRRRYRPWLFASMVLVVMTRFSSSLAATAMVAVALQMLLGRNAGRTGRRLVLVTLVAAMLVMLPLPISVDNVPIQDYVASRVGGLVVTDETDVFNLSSLVLLQGLELARLSVVASWGLGVGLGNFGTSMVIVEQSTYRALINSITANNLDLNLRDGALLASKIVGELGLLSLGFAWLVRVYLNRLRHLSDLGSRNYHVAFAAALFSLLFVRAMPYFAAPACLAIASMASLLAGARRRQAPPVRSAVPAPPLERT